MRYRLRTLLIVLAILPPLLAVGWWKYAEWKAEQERQRAVEAQRGATFRFKLLQAQTQLLKARELAAERMRVSENVRAVQAQLDRTAMRALTPRENDYQAPPTYPLVHYGPSRNN